jgi:hypothetical protein
LLSKLGGGGALVMTPTQLCTAMLPILRILPVGGVLLAILILVLALSPPDGSRAPLSPTIVPARGALVDRDHRPEVRQFLIHAALKRANELNRLRELPDTPTRSEDTQPQMAGIPADRIDTDPHEAGSINETAASNIPAEANEPSPIELTAPPPHDLALAVKKPEQAKPQREARRRAYRPRNNKSTATAQPHQPNLFEIFFGQQSASIIQQAGSQPYPYPVYNYQQSGSYQYQYPAYYNQQGGYQYQQPAYNQQASYQYQQPVYSYQQTGRQQHRQTQQANQSTNSTVPR